MKPADNKKTSKQSYYKGKKNPGKKRNQFKDKTSLPQADEEDLRGNTKASNDPSWYGADSQLMRDAANISLSNAAGLSVKLNDFGSHNPYSFRVPGIYRINCLCIPGVASNHTDALNVAARDIYTFVRHLNSGHSNYDAPDLMKYIFGMDNAYTFYAFMCRVYGLIRSGIYSNRYLPRNLLVSMGFDYDELLENMAQLRYYINSYAARLNTLCVPDNINIMKRHMWMFSNIYADDPTFKAQMYYFHPTAFWQFNETATPATYTPTNATPNSMLTLRTKGEAILNQILTSEDFNIMSGDIKKAYGDHLMTINMIGEDYQVNPIYDPEILVQIHNTTYTQIPNSVITAANGWVVTEDVSETANAGALVFQPRVPFVATSGAGQTVESGYLAYDKLIDLPTDNVEPKIVSIATRLMVHGYIVTSGSDYATWNIDIAGSEIPTSMVMYTLGLNGVPSPITVLSANGVARRENAYFMYHPLVPEYEDDGSMYALSGLMGDLSNYGVMTDSTLKNIHDAALLALYSISK